VGKALHRHHFLLWAPPPFNHLCAVALFLWELTE